jgi:hypothetical protein
MQNFAVFSKISAVANSSFYSITYPEFPKEASLEQGK